MPCRRSAVTYLYNDVFDIKTTGSFIVAAFGVCGRVRAFQRGPAAAGSPHSKKLGRAIAFKIFE